MAKAQRRAADGAMEAIETVGPGWWPPGMLCMAVVSAEGPSRGLLAPPGAGAGSHWRGRGITRYRPPQMLDRELVEAVKLAREAGEILREIYATDFTVRDKASGGAESDPVTEADTRVNAFLVGRIHEMFPADTIIAEESANEGKASGGRCWYIDPLDGTKEFIAKNGEFSVMIGLAVDGEARLGVVYQPTTGKLYRGVVGDGAFYEVGDKTWQLKVSDTVDTAKLRLVVSRSHRPAGTDELKSALGITSEIPCGSVGLKVGLIGERQADLYVHFSDKTRAWDACAPDAILRAAGGTFVDLTGRSIEYKGADVQNRRGLLATNRKSYEKVLAVITELTKKHMPPEGAA